MPSRSSFKSVKAFALSDLYMPQVNDFWWSVNFLRFFFIFLLLVVFYHWFSFFTLIRNNSFKKMFLILI